MSETVEAIACNNCEGVCCQNVTLALQAAEARKLEAAGTALTPILFAFEALNYEGRIETEDSLVNWAEEANTIFEMAKKAEDPKRKKYLLGMANQVSGMKPGEGLFAMEGRCGLLQEDNSCGDYNNRPDICQTYVMAGKNCTNLREERGIPVPVALIPKPEL